MPPTPFKFQLVFNSLSTDIKNGTGPASALYIAEIPMPVPQDTQALVKVKAFGLNRMDLLQREGMYPVPPQAPKTLGVEFSGTIHKVAKTAEAGFEEGDEVFGLAYGGEHNFSTFQGRRRTICLFGTI